MLSLERAARRAPDVQSLRYVIVNETRRLLPYRQAALAEGAATQNIHHKKERAQLDRLKRYGTLYFYEVHCT